MKSDPIREQLVALVQRIMDVNGTEEEIGALVEQLEANVLDPGLDAPETTDRSALDQVAPACRAGGGYFAASAAPTIPASLRISAGTTGVSFFRWGRYFSCFLLTPPPRMKSSGLSRSST